MQDVGVGKEGGWLLGGLLGERRQAFGRSGDEGGRLLMALNKEKVVGLSSRRMLLKNNAIASNIAFF